MSQPQIDFLHALTNKLTKVFGYTFMLREKTGSDEDKLMKIERVATEGMDLITEFPKKMANYEFQKNAELLSLESALNQHAIVAKTDIAGIIIHVNDRFCLISGYQREELIGRNHRILNSGHHPKSLFQEMWKTISSGKTWRNQLKNRAKDGTYYWVDTIISPVIEHGVVKEYLAFRFDITRDKKRQEISLAIADIRLKYSVLSSNHSQLFDFLTKKIILLMESESAYLSKDLATFKPEFIQRICDSQLPQFIELEGKPCIIFPFYKIGQLDSFFCIEKSNIHFDGEIMEDFIGFFDIIGELLRTSKIEECLSQKEKFFLHNSKLATIGELAAGVAHEVNNPLAIGLGLLSMIHADIQTLGIQDDVFEERFKKINIALNRIGLIVSGLRTYSRIDSEEMVHFNPMDALSETIFMMKDVYNQQGIRLELNGCRGEREIFGNRGRLQQVFVNLITNAKDATLGRPLRKITIQYSEIEQGVSISFIDNGRGIPRELQEKIFEPFFTTKNASQGTGIGLTMVSSILKEHDGSLSLNSVLEEGTTFTIILPVPLLSTNVQASHTPSVKADDTTNPIHFSGNILIVDDESDLLEILSNMLGRLGFNVMIAMDGEQALTMIKHQEIDLVISDISMPVMDGFTFLETLRSDSTLAQPNFVFVTGGSDANDEKFKTLKGHFDGVLKKPYQKKLIVEKLQFLFKTK